MIRSMTGFGRSACRAAGARFEVEVRSVNHRYLDARVRVPRLLSALEGELRERVAAFFSRGKVDVSVVTPEGGAPLPRLELDLEAARAYAGAARELSEAGLVSGDLSASALLSLPGVAHFLEPELPLDSLRAVLLPALDEALAAADAMRTVEGRALEGELLERMDGVERRVVELHSRADDVQRAVREKLAKRAAQLQRETGLGDDARLHQEVVIAADRLDVTEELVRLGSHVAQFRDIVASGGSGSPVGRRLDFLLQEFGREVNTVGSKGSDASLAHQVVELKTELERLREQVQNVE